MSSPGVAVTDPNTTFTAGGDVAPFSGIQIVGPDPNDTIVVTFSEYSGVGSAYASTQNGILTGPHLTQQGTTYTLTDTEADINTDLANLTFTPPYQESAYSDPGTAYETTFTYTALDETTRTAAPYLYFAETAELPAVQPTQFLVVNTSAGPAGRVNGTPYSGPVSGIQTELNYGTSSASLNVTSYTPNVYILTGSGNDGINVSQGGGNNILDGGTGSNFLTGGQGDDTFYLDARTPTSNVWDTVVGFHSGDAITVWGVTTSDFSLQWLDNRGAPGATGLTGVFSAPNEPAIGLTIAGFSSQDLTDDRLQISYGRTPDEPGLPGSTYMHIQES